MTTDYQIEYLEEEQDHMITDKVCPNCHSLLARAHRLNGRDEYDTFYVCPLCPEEIE